jgi:acyl carrier protein
LQTTAEDVDGWDSLAHARLILALEERFGVEFPAARLFDLKNIGELIELIEASRL